MKVKTSLTLSEELVEQLDRMAGAEISRSSFIERILREYVEARARARREARDVAIINKHAGALNQEMEDILSFQTSVIDE